MLLCLPLLLSGCAAPPPKPASSSLPPVTAPAAPPAPVPTPSESLGSGWRDTPIAPGDWIYRRDARGSIALYGQAGQDALVMLRCDAERRMIFLSRAGQIADGGASTRIFTDSGSGNFTAHPTGAAPPYAAIALPVGEVMLDRMVFTRGRFSIYINGLKRIVLPNWGEFARVVEDCRG
jgi:hypothetical protein